MCSKKGVVIVQTKYGERMVSQVWKDGHSHKMGKLKAQEIEVQFLCPNSNSMCLSII